jgi:hypothetical protein
MLQCFSLLFFTVVEFLIHCIETNEKEKKKKKGFSSCKCAEIRGKRIRFLVFSWKKLGRRKKSVTHIVNY